LTTKQIKGIAVEEMRFLRAVADFESLARKCDEAKREEVERDL
jgi:hypothetical protein